MSTYDTKVDIVLMIDSYEPELHPGVTFRIKSPKATLKIFSTGSVTITGQATCVCDKSLYLDAMCPVIEKCKD